MITLPTRPNRDRRLEWEPSISLFSLPWESQSRGPSFKIRERIQSDPYLTTDWPLADKSLDSISLLDHKEITIDTWEERPRSLVGLVISPLTGVARTDEKSFLSSFRKSDMRCKCALFPILPFFFFLSTSLSSHLVRAGTSVHEECGHSGP